jgi:hypothetical protein
MHTVITKFTRPSKEIPYYIDTDASLKEEFIIFLIDHWDLFVDVTTIDSVDGLTQTNVVDYQSEEIFNLVMEKFNIAFPLFFENRDAYCNINNIIVERTVETTS